MHLPQRLLHFLVFSSLFIASCAVIMTAGTNQLFWLEYDMQQYLLFVFFSTICSYNFHWYLTPKSATEAIRIKWTQENRLIHILLFGISFLGSAYIFFQLIEHWIWLSGGAILTFLYSAPKLNYQPFIWLRKIAIGKTIFLAFVWMYVTTAVPFILGGKLVSPPALWFVVNRFFFIYAICILFDYRDRINDRKQGIRSMITYFDETGINRLFYGSIVLVLISTIALQMLGFSSFITATLFIPVIILVGLYSYAKRNFSDYLYYIVLDGLMMLSALIQLMYYF